MKILLAHNYYQQAGGEDAVVANETDAGLQNIRWVGRLSSEQVSAWMQRADFLVVPSIWYETFCLVVIEAFAHGLPVFASRIGALAELIDDGTTGRLFSPGNYKELRDLAEWAVERRATLRKMGQAARATYEAKYSPQANYDKLEKIYRHVVGEPTVS